MRINNDDMQPIQKLNIKVRVEYAMPSYKLIHISAANVNAGRKALMIFVCHKRKEH